jgi:hypothetical protein
MPTTITMKHVRDYFNTDTDRPVTMTEFSDFWKSCTDEQKADYKAQVGALQGATS